MGLSGAAKKQRIQDDPRNLRWAQDTSAPGFRLLASMGWDPSSNPSLGNSDSQAKISANGGTAFSKKISSIPIAKEDNLGIGMKRGSAASVVGSLKAIGVPTAGLGATAAKVSGFVTAGSGSSTPNGGQGSSQGGEFGGLLARLNKMKEQGSLVATPVVSDSDEPSKKRKRTGSTSSASSSSSSSGSDSDSSDASSDSDSDSDSDSKPVIASIPSTSASPAPALSSFAQAILKNPRMAARSKHLRAKRMATATNASAMAEILGLAPTPSPSSSGASTPALAVAPPSSEGWPVVPPKGSSAIVQTTTITTSTSTTTQESDRDRKKREKAEKKLRKEAKAAKKAAKKAKKEQRDDDDDKAARLPSPAPVTRRRCPSPAFKVHSAQHDPFHVSSDTPTSSGGGGPAPKAAGIYSSMFVSSKQGGMGATWTPPTSDGQPGKLEEAKDVPPAALKASTDGVQHEASAKEGKEKKHKKEKKEKKEKKDSKEKRDKKEKKEKKEKSSEDKKSKKRKADDVEGGKSTTLEVDRVKEPKETKDEKRARKEAKRAKKEAKRTA